MRNMQNIAAGKVDYEDYSRSVMSTEPRCLREDEYVYPQTEEGQENKLNNKVTKLNGPVSLSTWNVERGSYANGPYVSDLRRTPPVPAARDATTAEYLQPVPGSDEHGYESLDAHHGTKGTKDSSELRQETKADRRLLCLLVVLIICIGLGTVAAVAISTYIMLHWPPQNNSGGTGASQVPLTAVNVAFSAHIKTQQISVNNGDVIVWDTCQLEGCEYYNNGTGEYTAPVPGLYMFSVQKFGRNDHGSFFLLVDNQRKFYTRDLILKNDAVMGRAVVLIQLTEGQKVSVQNLNSQTILGSFENIPNSWFSGTLL